MLSPHSATELPPKSWCEGLHGEQPLGRVDMKVCEEEGRGKEDTGGHMQR
jgi:hypothetical protein